VIEVRLWRPERPVLTRSLHFELHKTFGEQAAHVGTQLLRVVANKGEQAAPLLQ
jgi:hypothetical protein